MICDIKQARMYVPFLSEESLGRRIGHRAGHDIPWDGRRGPFGKFAKATKSLRDKLKQGFMGRQPNIVASFRVACPQPGALPTC